MEKLYIILAKMTLFVLGWMLCASLIPIPQASSTAMGRLWEEVIPLACLIAFTVILWILDKRQERIRLIGQPVKSGLFGIVGGFVWIIMTIAVLSVAGVMYIDSINRVTMLGAWLAVILFNVAIQELLVRGYLYHMLQMNYNTITAVIITTVLFTVFHGGALTGGVMPILNMVTMSLVLTAAMEYTDSLLAPVLMHFMRVSLGAVLIGGAFAEGQYPFVFTMGFEGSPLLSGGDYQMDGSLLSVIVNVIFAAVIFVAYKKKPQEETEEE